MAEGKKSFVAYCDWIETFDELSNEEAGKLVKHLFKYVNDLDPESSDKLTKMCFIPIQQSLKRDLKKYDKYIDKQKVNGAKGGRPKKNPDEPKEPKPLFENPLEPKKADSVSVSDSVNETNNKTVAKRYDDKLYQFTENFYLRLKESGISMKHPKIPKSDTNVKNIYLLLKDVEERTIENVIEVAKYYFENIEDPFMPAVQSTKSFRAKYHGIINHYERSLQNTKSN